MTEDIYDPLTEYVNVFCPRFKDIAGRTFDELAKEANVDIEANKATCRLLYQTEDEKSSISSRISRWKMLRALLWTVVIGLGFMCWYGCSYKTMSAQNVATIAILAAAAFALLFAKVNPRLSVLETEHDRLANEAGRLRQEAWDQMAPLNRLYDWDVLTRMMSETVPRLEFDPYFTTQRLADLQATYGWDGRFNEGRSVVYSHSGLINGNPFVICRTKKMNMGTKTYTGTKTIHWTTQERGSDGKYHTVHHSETLTASVTAPYPEYFEKTRLIYGNTAAPDLTFYREQSGLASEEGSWSYKKKKRALRKKSRNLTDGDYAMLTNEDFEVAFDTSSRNNNQQFALLFTPLAQDSMLKLLKDRTAGYGDDFDFDKDRKINTIIPDHMQEVNLDMNPDQYRNFDFEKAKADFYNINAEYFRAIYFALAPLLCVPMYQQIRSQKDIYGHDMERHSSFWEHEALANFWGQSHFQHPDCVTDSILKTEQSRGQGDDSTITVYAHGYRSEQRVEYIARWGGDGRCHQVPVYWDEYLPVVGKGQIQMREDNDFKDCSISQSQRLRHIDTILNDGNLQVYRRHIASRA